MNQSERKDTYKMENKTPYIYQEKMFDVFQLLLL